jgi:polyisoprenoid-binding protein YceI
MKIRTLIAGGFALSMAAALSVLAADQTITYTSARGSSVLIEGTANMIHTTWFVRSEFIVGSLQVGPGFPTEPGQAVTPGKVEAQATNVFIQVRSIKSVEKEGKEFKHYSDSMDEILWEHLKVEKYPAIRYRLTELTLKEAPRSKDGPYLFDSRGELAIAGITRTISMPVSIFPLEGKKLKITGSPVIKMSDYQAGPVEKAILGVGIKTGDEVKLSFEWMLRQWARPPWLSQEGMVPLVQEASPGRF